MTTLLSDDSKFIVAASVDNLVCTVDIMKDFIEKTKRGEPIDRYFLYLVGDESICNEFIDLIMEYITVDSKTTCKKVTVQDLQKTYLSEPSPTVENNCGFLFLANRIELTATPVPVLVTMQLSMITLSILFSIL